MNSSAMSPKSWRFLLWYGFPFCGRKIGQLRTRPVGDDQRRTPELCVLALRPVLAPSPAYRPQVTRERTLALSPLLLRRRSAPEKSSSVLCCRMSRVARSNSPEGVITRTGGPSFFVSSWV